MNKITKIEDQDFFINLIEECRAIIVERGFLARLELIKGKWELGDRILSEEENFKRFGYGDKIVEKLAPLIGISTSHLWKIIQFRKIYTSWETVESTLPKGKDISWFRLCQNILPKSGEEKNREKDQEDCKHLKLKCVKCGKEINLEDLIK